MSPPSLVVSTYSVIAFPCQSSMYGDPVTFVMVFAFVRFTIIGL